MRRAPITAFGALVVATVGAFFVTQHIKVNTPLFNGPRLSARVFSPRHGGVCGLVDHRDVRFSFFLQHRSDDVGVYVLDQSGTIVRTLATSTHMRGGVNAVRRYFPWNGREDNGRIAPNGTYYFRIALLGEGRTFDVSTLPVTIKSNVPRPVVSSVSPSIVGPGTPVTINYFDYHRSGTIRIYRTDVPQWWRHPPVKLIGTKWAHNSVVWDGLIRGRPASAGTYLVGFAMTDAACNTGTFPTRLPPASGSTPGAGLTLRYLAAEPTFSPVAPGSRALVLVDSRREQYRWNLFRAGVRAAVGHGTSSNPALRVKLPRAAGAGLYVLSIRAGAHHTAIPLMATSGARPDSRPLVVLPGLTWQGLNPVDDHGDGIPDTLDAGGPIRLSRPLANGLPADVAGESAFLAALDKAHLPYDLTTDLDLANRSARLLAGRKFVVFAGTERWLPAQLATVLGAYVKNGGNVLSFGIDSLRRTATLRSDHALAPTPAAATDIFGARAGPVVSSAGNLILVEHDGLGIFSTTSNGFNYPSFEPITPPDASASLLSSAAGTATTATAIVGFKSGRGTVVEVGIPGFGAGLAHDVDGQELVRQLWTVLGR